jgi:hypothetical protein
MRQKKAIGNGQQAVVKNRSQKSEFRSQETEEVRSAECVVRNVGAPLAAPR